MDSPEKNIPRNILRNSGWLFVWVIVGYFMTVQFGKTCTSEFSNFDWLTFFNLLHGHLITTFLEQSLTSLHGPEWHRNEHGWPHFCVLGQLPLHESSNFLEESSEEVTSLANKYERCTSVKTKRFWFNYPAVSGPCFQFCAFDTPYNNKFYYAKWNWHWSKNNGLGTD